MMSVMLEICTAEPSVPGLCPLEAKIANAKLLKYKLPGSVQIMAELIQARCETSLSEIYQLINSVWIGKELLKQWKESIIVIVPVHKKG
jgi:hypothetical protein